MSQNTSLVSTFVDFSGIWEKRSKTSRLDKKCRKIVLHSFILSEESSLSGLFVLSFREKKTRHLIYKALLVAQGYRNREKQFFSSRLYKITTVLCLVSMFLRCDKAIYNLEPLCLTSISSVFRKSLSRSLPTFSHRNMCAKRSNLEFQQISLRTFPLCRILKLDRVKASENRPMIEAGFADPALYCRQDNKYTLIELTKFYIYDPLHYENKIFLNLTYKTLNSFQSGKKIWNDRLFWNWHSYNYRGISCSSTFISLTG